MKTVFRAKSVLNPLVIALGVTICGTAQNGIPPKELVQYIEDATRRGVNEAKVKREAVAVGWSASLVDAALGYARKPRTGNSANPDAARAAVTNSAPKAAGARAAQPSSASSSALLKAQPALSAVPADTGQESGMPTAVGSGVPDDYQIGAGDTLQVSVWKEPDISVPNIAVRPDGMITVPLIKEVAVAGLTPRQAEKIISDKLSQFVNNVNVTVVVTAPISKKVYLIGAVRKEGPLPYTYRMTVIQALSEAGGLTEYAKRKKIYILRSESGKDYRLDFNYDEVVRGEGMEQNIPLSPGDTIVIPQ